MADVHAADTLHRGGLADTEHLIGALALTVAVTAMAESARPVRFLNICLGAALVIAALVVDGNWLQKGADILAGLVLIAASVTLGPIRHSYGSWSRLLV